MFELKTLAKEAIPSALKKAERYRLLNEPFLAAGICLDILQVAPGHQEALIMLLLAHTDKFKQTLYPAFSEAEEIVDQLNDQHCKHYYRGIIYERRAHAHLFQGGPSAGELAYDCFTKAMSAYERALDTCDPGNHDATLRWNTCARILNNNPHVKPGHDTRGVEVTDGYE